MSGTDVLERARRARREKSAEAFLRFLRGFNQPVQKGAVRQSGRVRNELQRMRDDAVQELRS